MDQELKHEKMQIEFVSANPTGPLNVVNARAAALGDSLARILSKKGLQVQKEYLVNDTGNQAIRLGRSLKIRVQQLLNKEKDIPTFIWGYLQQQRTELIEARKKYSQDDISPNDFLS